MVRKTKKGKRIQKNTLVSPNLGMSILIILLASLLGWFVGRTLLAGRLPVLRNLPFSQYQFSK